MPLDIGGEHPNPNFLAGRTPQAFPSAGLECIMPGKPKPWCPARAGSGAHCRVLLSSQGAGLVFSHSTQSCWHPSLCMPEMGLTSGKCHNGTVWSAPAPQLVHLGWGNENKHRLTALLPVRHRGWPQAFPWIWLQQQQSYNRN